MPFNGENDVGNLYHFTDSMRLPRILRSVELRPATYVDAMAGARDFLHATSNPHGEKTAATMSDSDGKFYRRSSMQRCGSLSTPTSSNA